MKMQVIKRKYEKLGQHSESNVLEPVDSWEKVQIIMDMIKYEYPLYEELGEYFITSSTGKTIYYVKTV